MSFRNLLGIELKKIKRGKIIPLLFVAPLLVVGSGVASLQQYFTPEYTNAWAAMFIQSALVYAYYLLPLSMIVVCTMIDACERGNNGIRKMLVLPVSRYAISTAKFCVLVFFLFLELVIFLAAFVIAGGFALKYAEITETLPVLYLLKSCGELFLTMLPVTACMWAITNVVKKPLFSVGVNMLLVIPGVLVANTPLWVVYPYCYSGYLVSCSLHRFTVEETQATFDVFPFLPCAVLLFGIAYIIAIMRFGIKDIS